MIELAEKPLSLSVDFSGGIGRSAPTGLIEKVPRASETFYFGEINRLSGQWEGDEMAWEYYDVFSVDKMPFDLRGRKNDHPRLIHADDVRHGGSTTLSFFDGHAEQVKLNRTEMNMKLLHPDADLQY